MAETEDIFATSDIDNPPTTEESTEEKGCPCKQKLTDGQKGILNFGLSNEMLKDPNAAAIGAVRQLGGRNGGRLANLIDSVQVGGGIGGGIGSNPLVAQALPSLINGQNKINSLAGTVDAFAAESARLSTPEGLLSTISSLSLFGELSCALGIEGLDIGVGLNVVNQNGQFAIQGAIAANVDLEKVLNQISPDAGTDLANQIVELQGALDGAFAKLDEVNGKINEIVDAASALQNQAADFIQKYTNIQALADLITQSETDPCFKLGSTINGSLVSPQFLNVVRGGTPTGFGSFR
jgi:hypothetical protein